MTIIFTEKAVNSVLDLYHAEGSDIDWWDTIECTDGFLFDINVTGEEFNKEGEALSYAIYPILDGTTDYTQWLTKEEVEDSF